MPLDLGQSVTLQELLRQISASAVGYQNNTAFVQNNLPAACSTKTLHSETGKYSLFVIPWQWNWFPFPVSIHAVPAI